MTNSYRCSPEIRIERRKRTITSAPIAPSTLCNLTPELGFAAGLSLQRPLAVAPAHEHAPVSGQHECKGAQLLASPLAADQGKIKAAAQQRSKDVPYRRRPKAVAIALFQHPLHAGIQRQHIKKTHPRSKLSHDRFEFLGAISRRGPYFHAKVINQPFLVPERYFLTPHLDFKLADPAPLLLMPVFQCPAILPPTSAGHILADSWPIPGSFPGVAAWTATVSSFRSACTPHSTVVWGQRWEGLGVAR